MRSLLHSQNEETQQIDSLSDSICVKLGTTYLPEPTKILNRFPIQNRREQARQQMSPGTARRVPGD